MKRRTVRIGGDDYEVMDEGNCFIETKRKRYSWPEGELKQFVARLRLGKPDKKGNRKRELADWGWDRYTGRDIVEICGDDYDKGRGFNCGIKFADVEKLVIVPAPKIEEAYGAWAISRAGPIPSVNKSRQRQHGPDDRPPYNRRTNPELGNQLAGFFRNPKNKDASVNAGATWAKELFARSGGAEGKGGPLKAFKEPCPSVLWRESKKQKEKMRYRR